MRATLSFKNLLRSILSLSLSLGFLLSILPFFSLNGSSVQPYPPQQIYGQSAQVYSPLARPNPFYPGAPYSPQSGYPNTSFPQTFPGAAGTPPLTPGLRSVLPGYQTIGQSITTIPLNSTPPQNGFQGIEEDFTKGANGWAGNVTQIIRSNPMAIIPVLGPFEGTNGQIKKLKTFDLKGIKEIEITIDFWILRNWNNEYLSFYFNNMSGAIASYMFKIGSDYTYGPSCKVENNIKLTDGTPWTSKRVSCTYKGKRNSNGILMMEGLGILNSLTGDKLELGFKSATVGPALMKAFAIEKIKIIDPSAPKMPTPIPTAPQVTTISAGGSSLSQAFNTASGSPANTNKATPAIVPSPPPSVASNVASALAASINKINSNIAPTPPPLPVASGIAPKPISPPSLLSPVVANPFAPVIKPEAKSEMAKQDINIILYQLIPAPPPPPPGAQPGAALTPLSNLPMTPGKPSTPIGYPPPQAMAPEIFNPYRASFVQEKDTTISSVSEAISKEDSSKCAKCRLPNLTVQEINFCQTSCVYLDRETVINMDKQNDNLKKDYIELKRKYDDSIAPPATKETSRPAPKEESIPASTARRRR